MDKMNLSGVVVAQVQLGKYYSRTEKQFLTKVLENNSKLIYHYFVCRAGCCGSSGGVTFSRGKRDIDTNDQEKRMPSCPSDCSCQAYFGECCETIGFYLKYFAYVINFGNIPSHITDAEWRSAFPTFNSRDQLERYFGEFRWPEVQCNTVAGTCP